MALIFRPRHDGQKPRPLQLNATSRVSSQLPQPPAIQSATRSAGWTALSGILERVLDDDQIEESAFVCNCRRNAGAVDRLSVLARRNTLSTTLLAATAAPSPTPAERSRPDAPTRSTRRKRRGRPFAAGHVRRDLLRGRALPLRTGRFATGSGAARLHERDRSGEGGVSRFECRLKNHQPHHRPSRQARPRRRPALRRRTPGRRTRAPRKHKQHLRRRGRRRQRPSRCAWRAMSRSAQDLARPSCRTGNVRPLERDGCRSDR